MRLLVLLTLLIGCPTADEPQPLTFATYNLGLAVGFVPGANERAPAATDAVLGLEADVVCVQEVWEAEHVALLEGSDAFPHTFFGAPQPEVGPEPACVDGDEDNLLECMETDCADACTDELPVCLLDECALDFLFLEDNCMRCMQANVGGTPEQIRDTCTSETTEYSYGGAFGTGILSKHPMSGTEELLLESTTSRRSVLHAVVAAPGGDVDVFCTHLTAVFSLIPYPRPEGDWDVEQLGQITAMRAWMADRGEAGRTVLMGDMNTGLEGPGVDPEVPANYEPLAAGLDNPYRDLDGRCTFCDSNPISSADSDASGRLIDHVFFEGFDDGSYSAARLFDEALPIESCGEELPGALSDHYGVQVTWSP